jgi:hypothetical protein
MPEEDDVGGGAVLARAVVEKFVAPPEKLNVARISTAANRNSTTEAACAEGLEPDDR